jgi:hypothetical protein
MTSIAKYTYIAAAQILLTQMSARSHVAPKRLVDPGPTSGELELIFKAAESST